jgi:hypothetical protein
MMRGVMLGLRMAIGWHSGGRNGSGGGGGGFNRRGEEAGEGGRDRIRDQKFLVPIGPDRDQDLQPLKPYPYLFSSILSS